MKLEDIARKAGVSRSTVSRVINGENYVSPKTREKVLAVIEQEGFSPNPAARMLVTQRTQVIGVVITHPLQELFSSDDPYYFPMIIQGIAETTQQRDYAMLLWLANYGEDNERFHQRVLKNRLMDGVIVVASVKGGESLLENLRENQTPFVLIGRPWQPESNINYVNADNVMAARQVVLHLLNLGRRRVGTITGDLENVDGQDRLLGYESALKATGIPHDPNLVAEGRFSRDGGYMAMQQLLKQDVDGVFTASDITAMGAMQAIKEAGLRIPEDIAVVSIDDLPTAQLTDPPLTTVRQPIFQKGAYAASLIIDLVEGVVESPVQTLLPTQLVIRQSCGAGYNQPNSHH
jgi:LacI family transcriptional regulator